MWTILENVEYTVVTDCRLPKIIFMMCGHRGVLEKACSSRVLAHHAETLSLSLSTHTQKWNSLKHVTLCFLLNLPCSWTLALVFGQVAVKNTWNLAIFYLSTNKTQRPFHKKKIKFYLKWPSFILPQRAPGSLLVRAISSRTWKKPRWCFSANLAATHESLWIHWYFN